MPGILAVGNSTIDVAAKVAEAGIAASSADIQRLEQKLVNTMKQIGESYESIIVCNTEGIVYADSVGGSNKGISVPLMKRVSRIFKFTLASEKL